MNLITPSHKKGLLNVLDHTFLKSEKEGLSTDAQRLAIENLVHEAVHAGAYAICVRDSWTSFAREKLLGSSCKLAVTIGFPDGDALPTSQKAEDLRKAKENGADEFDIVLRVGAIQARQLDIVYRDILDLSKEAGKKTLKVILETDRLSLVEKQLSIAIAISAFADAKESGIRFLKTSTGFVPDGKGATLEDLLLFKKMAPGIGIKASGSVSTLDKALEFSKIISPNFDPNFFRIGSSSLLAALERQENMKSDTGSHSY